MKIYLDNGSTTKTAPEVVKAMLPYFTEKYGNASSLHSFGQEAAEALEQSRKTIAKTLNAEPKEIIFTSGGTESDNMAVVEIAKFNMHKGNHVITTKIEHPAVMKSVDCLKKQGFKITYLDVDKEGFVNSKQLEKEITKNTILVSIIHANNEIGTIQDIDAIGKICKKHNVLFHTDAVQSFTKIPIDVKKIYVNLISISAHKLHGPKGIGALYIRKGTPVCPLIVGGGHEMGLRAGTENVSGAVGFAKAVELAKKEHVEKMEKLRDYFIQQIEKKIPDIKLNGSKNNRLCNNINISFNYIEGESLLFNLDNDGIAVSTGSACSSKSLDPSHVLIAIGLKHEIAHGAIRFTISRYTTKEEIDYAIEKLTKNVEKLRKMSPLR